MFKSSRKSSSSIPSTPKIVNVSLPGDDDMPIKPRVRRPSVSTTTTTSKDAEIVHVKPSASAPTPSRPRRDSEVGGHVSRNSGYATDTPVRPLKSILKSASKGPEPVGPGKVLKSILKIPYSSKEPASAPVQTLKPILKPSKGTESSSSRSTRDGPSNPKENSSFPPESRNDRGRSSEISTSLLVAEGSSKLRNKAIMEEPPSGFQKPRSNAKGVSHSSSDFSKSTHCELAKFTPRPMKQVKVSLNRYICSDGRFPSAYTFDIGFNIDDSRNQNVRYLREAGFVTRRELNALVPDSGDELTAMSIQCLSESPMGFEEVLWPVVAKRPEGLRVIDLFKAIYETFHYRLTPEELDSIHSHHKEECHAAFVQRCRDGPYLDECEMRRGMRRVDSLAGKKHFGGLKWDEKHSYWVLFLIGNPTMWR